MSAPALTETAEASRRVFTVRASSWSTLFDCAYRWEGQALLGITKPSGLRAQLGTAVHAATAAFDASRLPGHDPIGADEAADVLIDTLHNPDRDVDYSQDELTPKEATSIGLRLVELYCYEVAPQVTFESVERKLAPLDVDCGDGIVVRLTGSMDRGRTAATPEGPEVWDLKSSSRIVERGKVVLKGRAPQFGVYQLMHEHDPTGGPTSGSRVLALSTGSRPEVALSHRFDGKRVLVGTPEAPGLIRHAAAMFKSGLFPPNPSSPICSERYCARWSRCPYHD